MTYDDDYDSYTLKVKFGIRAEMVIVIVIGHRYNSYSVLSSISVVQFTMTYDEDYDSFTLKVKFGIRAEMVIVIVIGHRHNSYSVLSSMPAARRASMRSRQVPHLPQCFSPPL